MSGVEEWFHGFAREKVVCLKRLEEAWVRPLLFISLIPLDLTLAENIFCYYFIPGLSVMHLARHWPGSILTDLISYILENTILSINALAHGHIFSRVILSMSSTLKMVATNRGYRIRALSDITLRG